MRVSFVVMEELGISDALTLDRHFAAAGFVMVPGPGLGAPPRAPSGPWNRPVLGSGKPAKAIHELAVRSSRDLIY